jgi:hypothetical protein
MNQQIRRISINLESKIILRNKSEKSEVITMFHCYSIGRKSIPSWFHSTTSFSTPLQTNLQKDFSFLVHFIFKNGFSRGFF